MGIKLKLGNIAFLSGTLVTTLLSFGLLAGMTQWLYAIVLLMGLFVGFANITSKESLPFLVATITMVIVTAIPTLALLPKSSMWIPMLTSWTLFFGIAAIPVGMKAMFKAGYN